MFFVSGVLLFFVLISFQGYDVGDLPENPRDLMERILNDPEAR